jgi:hypothetical protein
MAAHRTDFKAGAGGDRRRRRRRHHQCQLFAMGLRQAAQSPAAPRRAYAFGYCASFQALTVTDFTVGAGGDQLICATSTRSTAATTTATTAAIPSPPASSNWSR